MTIYADCHVHFYRCFDLLRMLSAARDRARPLDGPLLLLLSESRGHDYFAALRAIAEGRPGARPANLTPEVLEAFPPCPSDEPESLRLGGLWLVAGRQLVSREAIEVLALAADPDAALGAVPDGARPARELVEGVLDAGALAVLPWGVGKWLGARGRRVAELLRDPDLSGHPRFFAGDIAQRCWPWPTPAAFRAPEPVRVLPGSDVLPVAGAEPRVAAYGLRLDAELDARHPADSLRRALSDRRPIAAWGRREGPLSTLREQLRHRRHGGDVDAHRPRRGGA